MPILPIIAILGCQDDLAAGPGFLILLGDISLADEALQAVGKKFSFLLGFIILFCLFFIPVLFYRRLNKISRICLLCGRMMRPINAHALGYCFERLKDHILLVQQNLEGD